MREGTRERVPFFEGPDRVAVDVESWLASGMDAFDIHEALRDGGVEQEIHRLKQLESSRRDPVRYLVEDDQR